MEELLELIVVIIVAGIGILSKSAKSRKKKKNSGSPWDEISEKITAGIEKVNELIENEGETPVRKSTMSKEAAVPAAPTVIVNQPTVAQNIPMPIEVIDAESFEYGEGDCDHPLHEPVEIVPPVPVIKPMPENPAPDLELERISIHRSGVIPGKVTAAQLKQAVVMSEVLGRPVTLRGAARR